MARLVCYDQSLQCRHNEHDGVTNHQRVGCFVQSFLQALIKENMKAPRHWSLWGEFTVDRWISLAKAIDTETLSIL